jgi:hypothetical protein
MNYRLLIDYEVIEFLETLSTKIKGCCATASWPFKAFRAAILITRNPTASAGVWIFISVANTPSSFGKIMPTGI